MSRARRAADQDGFESFYKEVRGRLLLQTFALTGDLQASQKAVRDAMVVAWHHWRKVSRLENPEDYARPLAWSRAQRRSTARWWARQKGLEPDAKSTLDSLAKLSLLQRKVLLLTHLTAAPLDQMAREVGATRTTVERELQTASAQFAVHRAAASTGIRELLEGLESEVESVRWPRPSILMRAGSARRRSHTTLGAAAAVTALIVSGTLVTDAAGVRPALDTKAILDVQQPERPRPEPPPEDPLTPQALLTTDQVADALPATWTEGMTTTNTTGDGIAFLCQGGRYADPEGVGALVRTFSAKDKKVALTAGQSAEASADEKSAARTYRTTMRWYAGCTTPRVQLLATYDVADIGEEAKLFVLRSWDTPITTEVVGVARTGTLTTTVVNTRADESTPDLRGAVQLLGDAVDGLCVLESGDMCAAPSRAKAAPPVPVRPWPAMLHEVDLPPVMGVDEPWVGTEPVRASQNVAATRCEEADFSAFSHDMTRTFLIPDAPELPAEFGITETVGALPERDAGAFVADVRRKLATCPDRDLGTEVMKLADEDKGARELTAWRLTVEVSEERSVRYLMAVIRNGTGVAQLTFVPSGDLTMEGDSFVVLARRAQARLAELGPPES